jgi:DNA repair protein SbcD/Mre11
MKFIHFADAHLDSPFLGLSFLPSNSFTKIHQAPNDSLTKIVDLAVKEQVDLVLIAGDTFDSPRPNPSSQLFFAHEIERLIEAKIQVVMIFGNHDHMEKKDLLVSDSPYFKLLGDKEKIETITRRTKGGFDYDVTGFSYLNNHITNDLVTGFPVKSSNYTFGMMHAQEKSGSGGQNVYAPFNLSELKELNYNYMALGHIHLRQVLSQAPLIVYSGNIQGRHINEMGAKGCYLGEINEQTFQTQIRFIQTGPITWQQAAIKITEPISQIDLQRKILLNLTPKETTYYSLKITGAEFLNDQERELVEDSEFWQMISHKLDFDSQLVDVRFAVSSRLRIAENDQAYFKKAQEEVFTEDQILRLCKDWAQKDSFATELAQDSQFLSEVRQLAEVELNSKLKGN